MYTDDYDYECLFDVIEQYTASHQPPLKMSRVAAQVSIRSGMQKLLQMNDKEISILSDLSRNVSVNKTMKKYKIGSDKVHEILSTFESFIGSPIRKYRHLFHILS
jgi:alcohol dehydrogenase class IV